MRISINLSMDFKLATWQRVYIVAAGLVTDSLTPFSTLSHSRAPPPSAIAIAFVISVTNADAATTVAAAAAVPSPFQNIKES